MADPKLKSRLVLAVAAACGLGLGGLLGLHWAQSPSAAQKDQVIVRLDPAAEQGWASPCIAGTDKVAIPLKNYGPTPVTVDSVVIDADWSPTTAQQLATKIAPGQTAMVHFVLTTKTSQCVSSPVSSDCPTEAVLDATFTVTPPSGRSHAVRLPIGAWEWAGSLLYPYPDPPVVRQSGSC